MRPDHRIPNSTTGHPGEKIVAVEPIHRVRKSLILLIILLLAIFAVSLLGIVIRFLLLGDPPAWMRLVPATELLTGIGLAVLALALLAWVLVASVLAPIERLGKAAERIVRGEQDVPVPVERDYAEAHMLSLALKSLTLQIGDLREDLDSVVQARTASLHETNDRLRRAIHQQQDRESLVAQENRRLVDQLLDMAHTDSLTGVFNRRALEQMAETQFDLARAYDYKLGVALLDIDDFKRINDTFGHMVGDAVLCGVVDRCLAVLRQGDVIGRYGGEEFALVLPGTDEQSAREVAERVRVSVANVPIVTPAGPLAVTVSIGVAAMPSKLPHQNNGEALVETSPKMLLQRADQAQYQAKNSGKNRVVLAK